MMPDVIQPSATHRVSSEQLNAAIVRGVDCYFERCRQRVPAFVDRHFHYPGTWETNRVALGFDLLRAPLNLFWAPVYATLALVRYGCRKRGKEKWVKRLGKLPDGFVTRVQRALVGRVSSELLCLETDPSELELCITDELKTLFDATHDDSRHSAEFRNRIAPIVHEALVEYRITRTASSDITNALTSTVVGAVAFYKFTPGGVGIGFLLAAVLAKSLAVRDFFLGDFFGGIYYGLFPPDPSPAVTALSLTLVLVTLAVFASLSGLISDPVQSALGIHHRRLRKMIDHLQQDFHSLLQADRRNTSFRPRDQYLARLLDVFDMVKSHLT